MRDGKGGGREGRERKLQLQREIKGRTDGSSGLPRRVFYNAEAITPRELGHVCVYPLFRRGGYLIIFLRALP
jgi:hypothetical protein